MDSFFFFRRADTFVLFPGLRTRDTRAIVVQGSVRGQGRLEASQGDSPFFLLCNLYLQAGRLSGGSVTRVFLMGAGVAECSVKRVCSMRLICCVDSALGLGLTKLIFG